MTDDTMIDDEPLEFWDDEGIDAELAERARVRRGTPSIVATRIALAFALLSAWAVVYTVGLSSLSAARAQHLAYAQLRSTLVQETTPFGAEIAPGTPIALLEIPAINLRYVVVEGTAPANLAVGPGHKANTPMPGQAGYPVIYGRSLAYGGPFRHVAELTVGDIVQVTTGQGTFEYAVDGVRRAHDPLPEPVGGGASRLTLVTSEGVSWRSGWAADDVVYVDATLRGDTVPAPAGRPTQIRLAEQAMQGDSSALVPLLLWLQLLLVVLIGAAWAQVRWGGAQVWLAGAPIVFAVLWAASASAFQLLPNLM